jgi:hypothetical protein
MGEIIIDLFAVLGIFFVTPVALFSFLYFNKKMKGDLQKLEHQEHILSMELQKEQLILERMSLENKMLDRKIEQTEKK